MRIISLGRALALVLLAGVLSGCCGSSGSGACGPGGGAGFYGHGAAGPGWR